jgi:hypothetical protein
MILAYAQFKVIFSGPELLDWVAMILHPAAGSFQHLVKGMAVLRCFAHEYSRNETITVLTRKIYHFKISAFEKMWRHYRAMIHLWMESGSEETGKPIEHDYLSLPDLIGMYKVL